MSSENNSKFEVDLYINPDKRPSNPEGDESSKNAPEEVIYEAPALQEHAEGTREKFRRINSWPDFGNPPVGKS